MDVIATTTADLDLAAGAVVLSSVVDASEMRLCYVAIHFGDGAKDLDGTGGEFEIAVMIGSQVWQPEETITVGAVTRAVVQTEAFLVPAGQTVEITITSPNVADTDVTVTAYLTAAPLESADLSDTSLSLLVTRVLDGLAGRIPQVRIAYDPITFNIELVKGDDFKEDVRTIDIPVTLPDGVAIEDCTATFGAAKGSERIDRLAELVEISSVTYIRLLFDRVDTQAKAAGKYTYDAEIQFDDSGTVSSITLAGGVLTLKESYAKLPSEL